LYSIFVVLYNAIRDAPMEERLMQAFETSALLIMFVLLGKYLECKVKTFTSRAISELSRLTPDTANLVGIAKEKEFDVKEGDSSNANVNLNTKSQSQSQYEYVEQEETTIPLNLLQYNDILLLRPGEKSTHGWHSPPWSIFLR